MNQVMQAHVLLTTQSNVDLTRQTAWRTVTLITITDKCTHRSHSCKTIAFCNIESDDERLCFTIKILEYLQQ